MALALVFHPRMTAKPSVKWDRLPACRLQQAFISMLGAAMRTHIEFISTDFPAYHGEEEEINPGRFGKRLAEFLAKEFPSYGFSVSRIGTEDWGVMVEINNPNFPLRVGCGNYEEFENGFLCFIKPSKPYVRKWLNKIPTEAIVEKLATSLEGILSSSGKAKNLRWWSEGEVTHYLQG